MNILDLLKQDHRNVEELFAMVESSDESEHPAIFKQIKQELELHTHIEETLFYPVLKADGDEELKDITLEGIQEHRQVTMLIREISELSEGSEQFKPKLTVLMENVKHHVEEEESEMFPMVEDQFDEEALEEIGMQAEEEKARFGKKAASN